VNFTARGLFLGLGRTWLSFGMFAAGARFEGPAGTEAGDGGMDVSWGAGIPPPLSLVGLPGALIVTKHRPSIPGLIVLIVAEGWKRNRGEARPFPP